MGLFSSKKQQEAAARFTEAAQRETAEARKHAAEAEKVRKQDRTAATRAIARDLEANRRVCEANARDLRDMAAESERAARRWF